MKNRRAWFRIGLVSFALFLLIGAGNLLALPGDYCKICYHLGESGGRTCLNVGSGFGFNDCSFTTETYYIEFEGRTVTIEVPICRTSTTCTFVY